MKWIPVITVFALATVILWACSKDKFESKPRLEIKDYSATEVFRFQTLRIRLNYFDKEGDLDQAAFTAIRVRLNQLPLGTGSADKADTIRSTMPEFPPKDNGELTVQFDWDFLKESIAENDTIMFRFAVTDRAGNNSDTLSSDKFVIHMP